jgi:hypothetical protein
LIKGIKPATYDIEVSYAGYKAQSKKDILLKPSESKVLSFSILPDTKELKEVVIAAKVDRQTASGLLLQQKNLASISDGISSEAIKRSPDRTTGDALKRVSGVTVQDNKFVVVRGLADRYNIALINGVDLPTTEPDKKAFSWGKNLYGCLGLSNKIADELVSQPTQIDKIPGTVRMSHANSARPGNTP